MIQPAPEARQKVARGAAAIWRAVPGYDLSNAVRALKGRKEPQTLNMWIVETVARVMTTTATFGDACGAPFRARLCLWDLIQGPRAKPLALATLCRASGAS